ncbi:hypothetical protein JDV02_001857 [Purpureocillium takamizusanense]|uniref:Uncharacterized protein n=1 Tax=Purpureocillium takamizusanense TaxID=2060973 RepID=A0A9Q8QA63_9HYPO|nr:uncharacterized protein JDV02_001857 [Purpureocillium takamizusanense]UNI15314.1 hypothetical protein JDV02_001857 [Purpureocillium takamizusanense]
MHSTILAAVQGRRTQQSSSASQRIIAATLGGLGLTGRRAPSSSSSAAFIAQRSPFLVRRQGHARRRGGVCLSVSLKIASHRLRYWILALASSRLLSTGFSCGSFRGADDVLG